MLLNVNLYVLRETFSVSKRYVLKMAVDYKVRLDWKIEILI